jgi:hypothetical protein
VTVVPGVQQGSTNFLLAALEIQYPDATVLSKGWFAWLLTTIGLLFALVPNIWNPKLLQYYFRFAVTILFTLFLFYWLWLPIKIATTPGLHFHSASGVFQHFYNGINLGATS